MRIVVERAWSGDGRWWVEFSCSIGRSTARWAGREEPAAGDVADVEFELSTEARRGVNVDPVPSGPARLRADGEVVEIRATIESVDPDGVAYLRLAEDGLAMLEAPEGELCAGETIVLRVEPSRIDLYPY